MEKNPTKTIHVAMNLQHATKGIEAMTVFSNEIRLEDVDPANNAYTYNAYNRDVFFDFKCVPVNDNATNITLSARKKDGVEYKGDLNRDFAYAESILNQTLLHTPENWIADDKTIEQAKIDELSRQMKADFAKHPMKAYIIRVVFVVGFILCWYFIITQGYKVFGEIWEKLNR